ncbi:limbin isoform C [Patagioenas fasciata monilis]|uniref:Limbin isoform C n=1 Tax=Patagioenas fasciata monilis TaxID=372326 RepID=A0A1V4JFC0_PATFA|nr:limbin isoform C [Patagioenas fasciata monilis]
MPYSNRRILLIAIYYSTLHALKLPCPAEGAGAPDPPREPYGQPAAGVDNLWLQKELGCLGMTAMFSPLVVQSTEAPHQLLTSAASDDQWSHSLFALVPSWTKKILFKRESSLNHQLPEDVSDTSFSSGFGITLQKCGVVDVEHDPQTAYITLLINNTNMLLSTNITDLILLDNITGLHVPKNSGNKTTDGIQIYRKRFLQGGEYFAINYSACLDTKEVWDGRVLTLPAKLTFRSSSQNETRLVSLTASLTITEEGKTKISYSHAIHALGFFIAFSVSLVLTCAGFFIVYRTQILKWNFHNKNQEIQHDLSQNHKLEHSLFNSGDLFSEDIIMNDKIIDILSFEESGNMLQALEEMKIVDGPQRQAELQWFLLQKMIEKLMVVTVKGSNQPLLEVASLTRADAELEAYRMQICKEVIAMMLKNMVLSHSLFPHVEKRMSLIFKKQFLAMEKEIQEEYRRKMVALTAECNLETRKKMETQQQKARNANEEAEELIKKMNEKPAIEYRSLLNRLHRLEQDHLKRFLLVKQEEYFAKAYRQLAVIQRKELHSIFFTQITHATFKGELKLEAAKTLVEDYSKIQGDIEELMDFLQASKKYHLNRRFTYRKYLISKIHFRDSQASALINAAATQISSLIRKMGRAGHLPESHLGVLLDQAEAEINSVKQKFDHDLKQEKQKLRQKLITKRRREMLQKKERWKEQLSLGDPFRTTKEVAHYLSHWKNFLNDHTIEFEELTEKLDNETSEELKELLFSLTEKTVEELKRVQYGVFVQELVKLSVPKMFLLEAVEEHKKEMVVKHEQLEREEHDKSTAAEELLQLTRQKLSEELEMSISEQKKLRSWEQSLFMQLLSVPLSLSEEELLRMRQELHCCLSQVDSSLAWPKIRARTLLQTFEVEQRDAELLKVDQNLATTNKQPHSKMKKSGSRNRNKVDILKKCVQDKIFIYEDSVKGENLNKVKHKLLLEKECQLRDLENKLGEYITALAFQKTVKKTRMLELYTAIISVQALLFEQLSTSKTLSKLECIQILEAHNPEVEELGRKLENEMLHKESAQQQHLMSRQRWTPDGLGLSSEAVETNADRQVTVLLRQAMNKCRQFINLHQQSLRDEQWNCAVLEDLLENIEMDAFLALYSQELRLTGYLAKLTRVPTSVLHRILNLLLPSSSQSDILPVLDSISKYSDDVAESDSNADESGSCKKRRSKELWQALENKVRQDLINRSLEKIPYLNKRRQSLVKKKQLDLLEKASFIHLGWLHTHPPVERSDPPVPLNTATAEAIELLDTGEKVFLFRETSDPKFSLQNSPRKKKKNFLNSKKAARANMDS